MPRLLNTDRSWLANNFPSLVIVERPEYSLIEGRLHFHRAYDDVAIEDEYTIRLELPMSPKALPRLTETAGRLRQVLKNHPEFKGRLVELHMYRNEQLCLAAPQDLRLNYLPNPSAELLFDRYIVPYLYSQSHFERLGRWPWPHLPHDTEGIIAWYNQNSTTPGAAKETAASLKSLADSGNERAQQMIARAMLHDSFSPNSKCLCGSSRKQMQCHRTFMKLALALRPSD
jgi:hypothetical protein